MSSPQGESNSEYNFNINDITEVKTIPIGNEKIPLLIIDNFATDPESLVNFACNEVEFIQLAPPKNFYPGILAPFPEKYTNNLCDILQPLLFETFGFQVSDGTRKYGAFSITTLKPKQLHLFQRIPHVDNVSQKQLAILLYLCDSSHGGTSLYRHIETGYETLNVERMPRYKELCQKDFAKNGLPPMEYMQGSNRLFEQTASIEAKYNRLVIYPSHAFHSGNINPDTGLDSDPRKGRLTANLFVAYK